MSNDFPFESDCFHENLVTALRKEKSVQNINTMLEKIKSLLDGGHRFILSVPPHVRYKNHKKCYYCLILGTFR